MVKLPKWTELKKQATDPARVEEARRAVEHGRQGLAKRLAGPAAHLKNVGQEFKAGLTTPEASAADPTPPTAPAVPTVPTEETPA
jgi:hypothetical protein